MTRMLAGVFDRLLTFQVKTETRGDGGFGDPTITWATHTTAWAMRRIPRGSERFMSRQYEAQVDAIFTLRHPVTGLTSDMRLQDHDGTLYDITAILARERQDGGPEIHAFTHRD